jgi:hypothetical protein
VKPLEVIEQVRSCLVARTVSTMMHAFPLEHAEEASQAALSAQWPTALMLQTSALPPRNFWQVPLMN